MFASKKTEEVWRNVLRNFPREIQQVALQELFVLDKAQVLNDLRIAPANRLDALKDNRKGRHSIRINDQWRNCLVWTENGPSAVEVADYH